MLDFSAMYEGWKYLIWKDPAREEEARRRYDICAGYNGNAKCPHLDKNLNICKACGCYMPAKVRSFKKGNKCKKNKW